MIIQPDFLDHWKTRQLIELTGDESAPLALIRLWAYCQTNKRSYWPDMTAKQLASICRWGQRKPACHVALVKCGFVEKLSPNGFTAHDWNEYNAKLLANWENGKLGGRPKNEEKTDEIRETEKPTDNPPITQPEPIEQIEQNRTDELDKREKNRTERIEPTEPTGEIENPVGSTEGSFFSLKGSGSSSGLVQEAVRPLSRRMTADSCPEGGAPSLEDVQIFMNSLWHGAGQYAENWFEKMETQGWRDHKNKPVKDWKKLASSWASACGNKDRGVRKRTGFAI